MIEPAIKHTTVGFFYILPLPDLPPPNPCNYW